MDFRCCVRLIEYGSLWHGLDSPIIPLRYRLLRHHQVKSVRYSDRSVAEYSEFVDWGQRIFLVGKLSFKRIA